MEARSTFDALVLQICGTSGWRTDPDIVATHSRDWLGHTTETANGVAFARTTAEVAAIVQACASHGVAIVPQGGNTGLCGGSLVSNGSRAIILSLARMNRIMHIDADGLSATVEAGVILQDLHKAVEKEALQLSAADREARSLHGSSRTGRPRPDRSEAG